MTVEECPSCGGIWLAKGEIAALSRREEHSWLARFFQQSLGQLR
ncbi:MAG: zf-TFIIB domain-containing protein [Candidatus Binatia bacterium]